MGTTRKMNETLKFSWGHILAFLAIIITSYTTFSGTTYLTAGNFGKAAIVTGIIDIVLLVVFIGAQMAKATDRWFRRWIWVERVLLILSPFIFIAAMVPHSHFFAVHTQEGKIVQSFSKAINSSKQMFTDYESYAKVRMDVYERTLDILIRNEDNEKYGFIRGREHLQRQNMAKTLQLQLLSVNYESLRSSALEWIDKANGHATTWNPFLIGNLKQIREATHGWNEQLVQFSSEKMSNEESTGAHVQTFAGSNESLDALDNELAKMKGIFSNRKMPGPLALITAVIIYALLLFPYVLQDRHTKSRVSLLPRIKERKKKGTTTGQGGIIIIDSWAKPNE